MKILFFQLLVIVGLYVVLFSIAPDNPDLNLLAEKVVVIKGETKLVNQVRTISNTIHSISDSKKQSIFSSSVPAFAFAKPIPVQVNLIEKPFPVINTAPTNHFQIINETSLRDFPAAQGTVLNRLIEGEVVKVLENSEYFWWKVDYAGRVGWVKRHLLKPA